MNCKSLQIAIMFTPIPSQTNSRDGKIEFNQEPNCTKYDAEKWLVDIRLGVGVGEGVGGENSSSG